MSEGYPVLSVKDLLMGYQTSGERIQVSGSVNFDLFPGELVAVVGPNGVGKSTLLRTLAGVHMPLGGAISLNNRPLKSYTAKDLATNLSIVLTEKIPAGNLTAAELVALGRQPYTNWLGSLSETDKEVVRNVLEKLDLKALHNKACGEMSDGQLQRVMIGRALAQDTPLILLDEPTSHLDIYHKAYIFKLLRTIAHDTKKTILFSSHEIDLAIQLCDKILVLQPEEAGFGDPCSLIDQGSFQALFPSDLIKFDSDSGSFRIKK